MIERICAHCEQPYQTFPSIRPKYCSHRCASAAKERGTKGACAHCGTEIYVRPRRSQKFCSQSCAMTARNLTEANPAKTRDVSGERNPMFGRPGLVGAANWMFGRRGANAPAWKGGRKQRKDGYVLVVAPEGHPASIDGYILLHRLVMEQQLGRYLTAEEVVHHIDRNPSNNAPENLHLFATQADHIRIGHNGES